MKILYVEWEDAASIDEWTHSYDIAVGCPVIKSVGILIEDSKDTIVLALNKDEENSSYSCIMQIPKKMVKKKKVISTF